MRARKTTPARRTARDEPFNNPFRDEMRKLKRNLRAARASAAPRPTARERDEAPQSAAPRDEAEQFLDAAEGAVPLDGSRRVTAQSRAKYVVAARDLRTACEDPTADEHFDVRFSDQFKRGRAEGVSRETLTRLERGEFAVRSHVDLHGMPLDDARVVVDEFIADRHRKGERCVLVITGKGRNSPRQLGVLRENIPEWLACGPSARRVLAFVTARPCDGGEGALYVLLRRHASRKNRIDVESGSGV